jgi:hypothetical protein
MASKNKQLNFQQKSIIKIRIGVAQVKVENVFNKNYQNNNFQ